MSIGAIEPLNPLMPLNLQTPLSPSGPTSQLAPLTSMAGPDGTAAANPGNGGGFAAALAEGLQTLQGMQANSDRLAVQAATGDLADVHDYTIAATQAQLATQLAVAVRDKAVAAFTEIMRMQG